MQIMNKVVGSIVALEYDGRTEYGTILWRAVSDTTVILGIQLESGKVIMENALNCDLYAAVSGKNYFDVNGNSISPPLNK